MTPDEVRAMPAGQALDALAATMVMGWTVETFTEGNGKERNWYKDIEHDCWSPSTDIGDAMRLAEIHKSKWPQTVGKPAKYWNFNSLRNAGWSVTIRREDATSAAVIIIRVMGDLAHAITVAAILDAMETSDA